MPGGSRLRHTAHRTPLPMDPLHQPLPPARERLHRRYWLAARRLTGALLAGWTLLSFGLTWFARDLSFTFFGWPFSFWLASQGALIGYLLIVALYAWLMARLDDEHRDDAGD